MPTPCFKMYRLSVSSLEVIPLILGKGGLDFGGGGPIPHGLHRDPQLLRDGSRRQAHTESPDQPFLLEVPLELSNRLPLGATSVHAPFSCELILNW
jgi:hypothetical protein